MRILRSLLRNVKSTAIIFLIVCVLYVEWYTYTASSKTWQKLKCTNEQTCTKIVLVADPQLIGNHDAFWMIRPFSIWDIDRYLFKTYKRVFRFVEPHVVIFLGDLLDEGSTATDLDFNSYVRRLFNVFLDKEFSSTRNIWLPGDNDIGGEGMDYVTSKKIQRFNRAFEQPEIIEVGNISFYKINRLFNSIPKMGDNNDFFNVNRITVGLSHMPLLFHPSLFVDKVLAKLQPQLLFTAHEHKSMIISTDGVIRQDRQIVPIMPYNNKVYTYTLGINNMYEIIVPTCSYRMGTHSIGYGYAIIENDELQYTVLWSPDRLSHLLIYLVVFIVFMLIIFCRQCCKIMRCKTMQNRTNV